MDRDLTSLDGLLDERGNGRTGTADLPGDWLNCNSNRGRTDQLTRRIFVPFLPSVGLATALLYSLLILLPAAYRAPSPLAHLPDTVQPVNLQYRDELDPTLHLQLLAVDPLPERIRVGDRLPITVYLPRRSTAAKGLSLVYTIAGCGRQRAGQSNHTPWLGRNPTRLWQTDAIYRDSYLLATDGAFAAQLPARLRIYAGFVAPETATQGHLPLAAYAADGNEVTPILGEVVIEPIRSLPQDELTGMQSVGSSFGNVIKLDRLHAPQQMTLRNQQTISVTLLWQAVGTPASDYTAFVHLLDSTGRQIAGSDHPPAGERLPTRFWRATDQILDTHELTLPVTLPSGDYELWVGLYENGSNGGLRLPVSDAAELVSGDGVVKVATITLVN